MPAVSACIHHHGVLDDPSPCPASSPAARTVRRPRTDRRPVRAAAAQRLHATTVAPSGARGPSRCRSRPSPRARHRPGRRTRWRAPCRTSRRRRPRIAPGPSRRVTCPASTRSSPRRTRLRGHLADTAAWKRLRRSAQQACRRRPWRPRTMPTPRRHRRPPPLAASPIAARRRARIHPAHAAAPAPCAPPRRMPVTAGMVDDNADFGEYLRFPRAHAGRPPRPRRPRALPAAGAQRPRHRRARRRSRGDSPRTAPPCGPAPTPAAARGCTPNAVRHPGAAPDLRSGRAQGTAARPPPSCSRGQKSAVDVVLADSRAAPARARARPGLPDRRHRLDGRRDRRKLKTTLRSIANEVAQTAQPPRHLLRPGGVPRQGRRVSRCAATTSPTTSAPSRACSTRCRPTAAATTPKR